jgi:hypothetical protein
MDNIIFEVIVIVFNALLFCLNIYISITIYFIFIIRGKEPEINLKPVLAVHRNCQNNGETSEALLAVGKRQAEFRGFVPLRRRITGESVSESTYHHGCNTR